MSAGALPAKASDRFFGRRRILIAGILLFALASLACAAAPSIGVLLAGRSLQGVGAAMLMPNSLAILGSTFSGEEKGRAIGIWVAVGAMGAIGSRRLADRPWQLAGDFPDQRAARRRRPLAWAHVPDDRDNGNEPLDWIGGALATVGLGGLTWALTVGSGPAGWTSLASVAATLALTMLVLFLIVDRRSMAFLSLSETAVCFLTDATW